jgi:hypothetical protein
MGRRGHGNQASPEELPLSSIRILFMAPDTLTLWGIPYDMRPGQQPGDLWRAYRDWQPSDPRYFGGARMPKLGWIYLGQPGWYGSMGPERVAEVKAFRAKHKGEVPESPNEWVRLEGSAAPSHGDLRPRAGKHAYAVERLSGRRVGIEAALSTEDAVRLVARRKGISEVLLRGRRL